MAFQDVIVWLVGWTMMILSVLKLATWDGINGLMYLAEKFELSYLIWINDNFIAVWAIAGFLIYMMYRPNNMFIQMIKKIVTFGKG